MYNEGLGLHPNSFDMAYNKARIQYDITQRPSLLSEARAPVVVLLNEALQSHRRALRLEPSSPDVTFNTAQVLVSLAESVENDESLSVASLKEALALLEQCHARQEILISETAGLGSLETDSAEEHEQDGGVPLQDAVAPSSDGAEQESDLQWASIFEPTTPSSLVDTCCAALDALSAWYGLLDKGGLEVAAKLEEFTGPWTTRLAAYVSKAEEAAVRDQARCASLRCQSASLEAAFRLGAIDIAAYSQRLKSVVETERQDSNDVSSNPLIAGAMHTDVLPQSAQFLCTAADAQTSFSVAVADVSSAASARWTKLTTALGFLEQAAKLAEASETASIHLGRGDLELFRFALCLEGDLPEAVSNDNSRARLLKNAETYYKGASAQSQASSLSSITTAATVKLVVVMCLANHTTEAMAHLKRQRIPDSEISKVLSELVDETGLAASTLQEICLT